MTITGRLGAPLVSVVVLALGSGLLSSIPSVAEERVPAPAADRAQTARAGESVARAATPRLRWARCEGNPEPRVSCARVRVPLDYDRPRGATTTLQVTRMRAAKPGRRIGSLFVNPGGPGGPASGFAQYAGRLLGSQVDRRFDVVGIDPRGTGGSGRTTCTGPIREPYAPFAFPVGERQVVRAIATDDRVRRLCERGASRLLDHATTADNARDMELVRRALGEQKLSYYGISYGTYLGATYAALFPNRIRAMVVDGVLDPVAWSTGGVTPPTRPFSARLGSGQGAYEALTAAFTECDRVGASRCSLAPGALAAWERVVTAARQGRLVVEGTRVGYADVVSIALSALYDARSVKSLTRMIHQFDEALAAPRTQTRITGEAARTYRELVALRDRRVRDGLYSPAATGGAAAPARAARTRTLDLVFPAVACGDSRNPRNPRAWESSARQADRAEPWFGRLWTWASSQCARGGPVSGDDAFRGPWRTSTSYPLLVVGNSHDPATPISGARRLNSLFEDSVLVLLDGWGHGALGQGPCVTQAMGDYLVARDLPADGTVCAPPRALFP